MEPGDAQVSKPKAKHASKPRSGLFKRACRKGLLEKVEPGGKERWVNKVVNNLRSIASSERTALGMQAVKILIEQTEDEMPSFESPEEMEDKIRRAALEEKSEEELEADIAKLDIEIKELQQALGSVPTANP